MTVALVEAADGPVLVEVPDEFMDAILDADTGWQVTGPLEYGGCDCTALCECETG